MWYFVWGLIRWNDLSPVSGWSDRLIILAALVWRTSLKVAVDTCFTPKLLHQYLCKADFHPCPSIKTVQTLLRYYRDILAQADLRCVSSGFFLFRHLHQAAVFAAHAAEKCNKVCDGKDMLLHRYSSPIFQNSCSGHRQSRPGLETDRWQRAVIRDQMYLRSLRVALYHQSLWHHFKRHQHIWNNSKLAMQKKIEKNLLDCGPRRAKLRNAALFVPQHRWHCYK